MHLGAQAWVIRELFKIDITRIAGAVVSTDASKNSKKILDISYSGVFKDYVKLLWAIRSLYNHSERLVPNINSKSDSVFGGSTALCLFIVFMDRISRHS